MDVRDVLGLIDAYNSDRTVGGQPVSARLVLEAIEMYNGDPQLDCDSTADGVTVTVVDVLDGDTMEVEYQNGSSDTVRLLGVDTPETFIQVTPEEFEGIPNTSAGRDHLRTWGDQASTYATQVVENRTVTLVFDDQSERRGSFGRLLGYVQVNESYQLNRELIERGYARVYDSEFTRSEEFYAAEAAAQSNETGVWDFSLDSRTGDESLSVVEIHEDAAGDEYDNLDDEYVVFENTGDTTIDLGGYTVADEADHVYTFPSGVSLDPGEEIRLTTGIGTDTRSEVFWDQEAPVWNNGGDTVTVRAPDGTVVAERSYS